MFLFGVECGDDHSCVQDEIKIFQKYENELMEHVKTHIPNDAWREVSSFLENHIRTIALQSLSGYEVSEDVEEAVKKEILRVDLSILTA